LYISFYTDSPFTVVSRDQISLKQVINTNKCIIHLEKENDKLVVHSAIDNLLKGASGQAIENMNIMFNFERTAGLLLKSSAF
jgi:N-acetyl-gamma-glutamyl-phosphate reductase